MRSKYLWVCIILGTTACKKDKVMPDDQNEIISPVTGTRREFTLDSIYLYAKQIYLWNDALPDYDTFDPRNKYRYYTPDLTAFQTELYDIAQLKINPGTMRAYEYPVLEGKAKYSYMINGAVPGKIAAEVPEASAANPTCITTILDAGPAKVGYIYLSSFPELSTAKPYLDDAFQQFASAAPSDLIVDLRSNGGGYVETAEYLANLIAPPGLNGKVMYTAQFNSRMQQGKAMILRNQRYLDENGKPVIRNGKTATMADVDFSEHGNTHTFSKKGSLKTVKNLYFIVSGNTASASELLINSLKPYLNVKLAGSKTYGKPVGFFGVTIDRYTIYMSSFLIKNALGSADYFDGMPVDIPVLSDDGYVPGNPGEACLKSVLKCIQPEITSTTSAKDIHLKPGIKIMTIPQTKKENTPVVLNGMIEHRVRLKTSNNNNQQVPFRTTTNHFPE